MPEPLSNYSGEEGESGDDRVFTRGVVDDRPAANGDGHAATGQLFDQHTVKDDFAGIVGEIENALGRGGGLAEQVNVADERMIEGGGGGVAHLILGEAALGAEVDDVAGDGQANGGGKGIIAALHGGGQGRH